MAAIKIEDLTPGTGAEATKGRTVHVHYVGTLENGKTFDSSRARGEPFSFRLGSGMVIQGWDIGIVGMKVGGTRRLTIPPHLGYGDHGFPGAIPPRATLTFEVELISVQ